MKFCVNTIICCLLFSLSLVAQSDLKSDSVPENFPTVSVYAASVVVGAMGSMLSTFMLANKYMKYYFGCPDERSLRLMFAWGASLIGGVVGGSSGGLVYTQIFASEQLNIAEQWAAGILGTATSFALEFCIGFCVHKSLGVERELPAYHKWTGSGRGY